MDINPYEPPRETAFEVSTQRRSNWLINLFKAIAFITTTSALFSLGGGLSAYALNRLFPDCYQGVFSRYPDSAQQGLWTGIERGLSIGLLMSVFLAVGFEWMSKDLLSTALIRALNTAIVCTISCAVVGAFIGICIAKFVPGYYKWIFLGDNPWNGNETHIGAGLGFAQGLMVGMLVGTMAALIIEWRKSRKSIAS